MSDSPHSLPATAPTAPAPDDGAQVGLRPPLGALSPFGAHPARFPVHRRPVLYLDFDGVLHHEEVYWAPKRGVYMKEPGHALFEWMPLLEAALGAHPEVGIVLSTSWVRAKGYNYALRRLSEPLQRRVVGATFHRRWHESHEFQAASRGLQVWSDVLRRQPAGWVALDDDDFGWPAWCRNSLVRTEGALGLSEPRVQDELAQALQALTDDARRLKGSCA